MPWQAPTSDDVEKLKSILFDGDTQKLLDELQTMNLPVEKSNILGKIKARFKTNEKALHFHGLARSEYSKEKQAIVDALVFFLDDLKEIEEKQTGCRVFLMYDIARDEVEFQDFFTQLQLLKFSFPEIVFLDMHHLESTDEQQVAWEKAAQSSALVLCMVSPQFMLKHFPLAKKIREEMSKPIVPILMKNVSLENTFLNLLRPLPQRDKFIFSLDENKRDTEYAYTVNELKRVVSGLPCNQTK